MTDEELDGFMRRVLLDALQLEWSDFLEDAPPVETSKHYRHQMRKMVADPLAWYRKKTRPILEKAFRAVAAFLIICSLAFGTLMVASPTARAAVLQWVREWYETHIVYRYSGEVSSSEMPQYGISALPDDYIEIDRSEFPGYVSVTYQNQDGMNLYLDYTLIRQGSAADFVTDNMAVSDITVNEFPGQLFLSQTSEQTSAVTWIDSDHNIQFTVDGFGDEASLLHMAESVALVKSTK